MKILIVANSSAGLYNFRRMLIEHLLEKNEVVAYTPFNGSEDNLKKIGCKTHQLDMERRGLNPLKDFNLYRKIFRTIKYERPDLVITYTIKPNIYASIACRILNISYAVNITGLGTAFEKGVLLRKVIISMYKIALKKARVVFFENSFNRQCFIRERIVNEEKTCVLMGAGVDIERFSYQAYPQNDVFRFIFIGRIMHEKGIDELFEAMKRLCADGNQVILDICGNYEENYKQKIDEYSKSGWLNYHGSQEDVRPFIAKTDCFVLPSYHEGMANTNLECASSGRPIITSNIPGCMEAVIDGETGFLCEPQNVNSLYMSMRKMIETPRVEREKMGKSGRKHMEEKFDKKKVVQETINALNLTE